MKSDTLKKVGRDSIGIAIEKSRFSLTGFFIDRRFRKVFDKSQELCPVGLTSNLKDSGKYNKYKENKNQVYEISYSTDYASYIHERDRDRFGREIHHGSEFNEYWSKYIDKNPTTSLVIKKTRMPYVVSGTSGDIQIDPKYWHSRRPQETAHFVEKAFEIYEPSLWKEFKNFISRIFGGS